MDPLGRAEGKSSSAAVILLVSVAVAIATLSMSFVAPPPTNFRTFSGSVWTFGQPPCVYCPERHLPSTNLSSGANVTLRWTDVSGGLVEFLWSSNTSNWIACGPSGSFGNCTFESTGGTYWFDAFDEANQSMQIVTFAGEDCVVSLAYCPPAH